MDRVTGPYTPARFGPSRPHLQTQARKVSQVEPRGRRRRAEFRARQLRGLLTPLLSLRELSLDGQPEVAMGRRSGWPGLGLGPCDPHSHPYPAPRCPFQAGNVSSSL